MRFWDTSALFAAFVREPGSDAVRPLFGPGDHVQWWATTAEFASALQRRIRDGSLDPEGAGRTFRAYEETVAERFRVVSPERRILVGAVALLERYPLRAADALQLAAFLEGGGGEFVCLDRRLREAALVEGAAVLP